MSFKTDEDIKLIQQKAKEEMEEADRNLEKVCSKISNGDFRDGSYNKYYNQFSKYNCGLIYEAYKKCLRAKKKYEKSASYVTSREAAWAKELLKKIEQED
jgi:hypothetical protein